MPVVAAPAAVVGSAALAWYLVAYFSSLDSTRAGEMVAGFLFGLGAGVMLTAAHRLPVAAVIPPRWRRSVLTGAFCAAAVLAFGLVVFGLPGALAAIPAGLTGLFASRRTVVSKGSWQRYRLSLGLTIVVILAIVAFRFVLGQREITGIGVLTGWLATLILPVPVMLAWLTRITQPLPAFGLRPAQTQNLHSLSGYQEEALAFCIFLAPDDIPRSLVIRVAMDTKPGRATSLNSLAAQAFQESGPDSLNIDPLTQRLAYHRLAQSQRREWAAKAVRELAAFFPENYTENPAWCERLAPHALAAGAHAYELDTDRGAAALLLNQVAGYLLFTDRATEATDALHLALACAAEAFGTASEQANIIRANLAVSPSAIESFRLLSVATPRGSRRAREPMPEHRILALGLSIVVLIAAVLVGGLLWREAYLSRPQAADHPLRSVADLQELCADRQRFYPDAPAYAPPGPHQIQLFARESISDSFSAERLSGQVPEHWRATAATVGRTQLTGCVTRTRTGPKIATCQQPNGPELLVHQATYEVEVYSVRTAALVGSTVITITAAPCPAAAQAGRIFAQPSLSDYREAIGEFVE